LKVALVYGSSKTYQHHVVWKEMQFLEIGINFRCPNTGHHCLKMGWVSYRISAILKLKLLLGHTFVNAALLSILANEGLHYHGSD